MDDKSSFNDSLRLWGLGDTASAAKSLAAAGLGDERAISDALARGDFRAEALAQVREIAPKVAAQFPQLAAAVGWKQQ